MSQYVIFVLTQTPYYVTISVAEKAYHEIVVMWLSQQL